MRPVLQEPSPIDRASEQASTAPVRPTRSRGMSLSRTAVLPTHEVGNTPPWDEGSARGIEQGCDGLDTAQQQPGVVERTEALGESTASLGRSLERLSSGLRINRASDDAAGLAIAAGLHVDRRVYAQGMRNIQDGVSYLNV